MITVIVPVYNVEKYIDVCMESLVNQTYKDIEIIMINDGSTDSSGKLCDKWAEKDERVCVVHQENMGLAAVRNRGLELAKGKYIAWVDSDDYVDTHYLENLLEALEEKKADMAMCSFYTDTDGEIEHTGSSLFQAEEINRQVFLERLYTYGMYSVVWNKLISKDAYQGVSFPVGRIFEDSSVMCRLTETCDKVVVINKPLYYYRRHKESITLQQRNEEKSNKYVNDFCLWLQADVKVHQEAKNTKLVALASRHLCDAIIHYSEGIGKEGMRKWKQIFRCYKKNVMKYKGFPLKTKLKYFVGGISFSICRRLDEAMKKPVS